MLLALFIYWGWDTCLALNEETKDPKHIPGRAAIISTTILLVTYVGVTVAAMAYAGVGEDGVGLGNEANAEDVFLALKDGVMGPMAIVLVIAVMVSAVSSTQTTILPTARGTLSMATYRALPKRFKTVHPRFNTPSFSTLMMGVVASVYYVGMTLISDNILQDSITSLGLAIAFYYGITGFACVWYFRKELTSSPRNLFLKGILPLLGAVMLTYAFVQSAIRHVASRVRQHRAVRHRRHLRGGHRRAADRRGADGRLVVLRRRQAVLRRREPEPRDARAGARGTGDLSAQRRRRV